MTASRAPSANTDSSPDNGAVSATITTAAVALWTLGSSITLDTYSTLDGSCSGSRFSGGHGIDNHSTTPTIAGVSIKTRPCTCSNEGNNVPLHYGFKLVVDSTPTLEELAPSGTNNTSGAFDINNASTALIVGEWNCTQLEPPNNCWIPFAGVCDALKGGCWGGSNGSLGGLTRGLAYGANNNNLIVGFSTDTDCLPLSAKYWSSPSANAYDLGSHVPNGHSSQVFAINNLSLPKVVGRNVTTDEGLLFEKTGSSDSAWSLLNLNTSTAIGGASSIWTIRDAHDINDSNEIAAIATRNFNGVSLPCAVLLTPFPECSRDINQDGCVDDTDYNAVINHPSFGDECPPGVICIWDVDGDYDIDSIDALVIAMSHCYNQDVITCCDGCLSGFAQQSWEDVLAILIGHVLNSNNSSEVQATLIYDLLSIYPE